MQFQKRLLDAELYALDLAYHDPLTGLNNQRYMNTLFDQALMLAMRPHQILAVIYIDLDNFKPINDNAGHMVGDEVLKVIAKRLQDNTRSTDICARVGGDEFVILSHADHRTLRLQIRNFRRMVVWDPAHEPYKKMMFGVSCGLASIPADGETVEQVMHCADERMYAVKTRFKQIVGRGVVLVR